MNKKELWLRIKKYHFIQIVIAKMWEKINESYGCTNSFTKELADKISRKEHSRNWL